MGIKKFFSILFIKESYQYSYKNILRIYSVFYSIINHESLNLRLFHTQYEHHLNLEFDSKFELQTSLLNCKRSIKITFLVNFKNIFYYLIVASSLWGLKYHLKCLSLKFKVCTILRSDALIIILKLGWLIFSFFFLNIELSKSLKHLFANASLFL